MLPEDTNYKITKNPKYRFTISSYVGGTLSVFVKVRFFGGDIYLVLEIIFGFDGNVLEVIFVCLWFLWLQPTSGFICM